jgi:hypothetical protein
MVNPLMSFVWKKYDYKMQNFEKKARLFTNSFLLVHCISLPLLCLMWRHLLSHILSSTCQNSRALFVARIPPPKLVGRQPMADVIKNLFSWRQPMADVIRHSASSWRHQKSRYKISLFRGLMMLFQQNTSLLAALSPSPWCFRKRRSRHSLTNT